MSKVNKVSAEELEIIKDQSVKMNNVLNNIGALEIRKHELLHSVADLNREMEDNKVKLEEKYGSIKINVEDGTYTNIEDKE